MATTDILTEIADAEKALLKAPLLAFGQALQTPNANILTVQNAAANLLLAVPQLSAPAQSAIFNIVGASLVTWAGSISAPPAA